MNYKDEKHGFTLIELMIVIAIIGILAAIAIPRFSAYRTRNFNSSAVAELKNAATAQMAYFVDTYSTSPFYLVDKDLSYKTISLEDINKIIISSSSTGEYPNERIMHTALSLINTLEKYGSKSASFSWSNEEPVYVGHVLGYGKENYEILLNKDDAKRLLFFRDLAVSKD